jgi:pimeloyl-ACP methyl ester carboxylesterase
VPFKPVGDLDVYYELKGEGHPLVMIIGLSGSLDWWDPELLEALAERYRVLVFDNRGAGRTVTPEEGEITVRMMADDTAGLMDELGIGSAHVLGLSMGGMIAQELTLGHPEKVERLALASTNCGRSGSVFATRDVLKKIADRSGTPEEQVNNFCSVTFCEDWLASHEEDVETFTGRVLVAPVTDINAVRQFYSTVTFDACERIDQIDKPTLVMAGTEDILIPPENSRIIADRIPGARLIEYEGAAHLFIWERRDDFLRDLTEFLG